MPTITITTWLMILAYLGLVIGGLMRGSIQRNLGRAPSTWRFWWMLAAILLMLALNRYLAVQVPLGNHLRDLAVHHELYGHRRPIQALLLILFILIIIQIYIGRPRLLKILPAEERLALWGGTVTLLVAMLRVVSFHYSDTVIQLDLGGISAASLLELVGLGMIALALSGLREHLQVLIKS
jgi:hypothetical protein